MRPNAGDSVLRRNLGWFCVSCFQRGLLSPGAGLRRRNPWGEERLDRAASVPLEDAVLTLTGSVRIVDDVPVKPRARAKSKEPVVESQPVLVEPIEVEFDDGDFLV